MKNLRDEMIYHDWCPITTLAFADGAVMFNAPPAMHSDSGQPTLTEYQAALTCCGVRYFSAKEIATPNDIAKAKGVGYDHFVPPKHCWALSLLVVGIANRLRALIGKPIKMRNHWRPQSYNAIVSSSGIDSDHPNACAVDLDFASEAEREMAMDELVEMDDMAHLMPSIGIDAKTLHIGIMSPCGPRYWTYDSFKGEVPDGIKVMCRR